MRKAARIEQDSGRLSSQPFGCVAARGRPPKPAAPSDAVYMPVGCVVASDQITLWVPSAFAIETLP